jgi:cytochrome c553
MKTLNHWGMLTVSLSFLLAVPIASIAAESLMLGDATRGAALAGTCQACHGANGEGNPAGGFPRLAGQNADYLAGQLRHYADGQRTSPIMTPVATALDAQKRADVAAFYAMQSAPYAASAFKASASQLARGRQLTRIGDESKQLQACANCHGPDGSGERYAAPYLAGQSATYLTHALREWKSGARHGGQTLMGPIVARLDDQDIAALSVYFERLGESSH